MNPLKIYLSAPIANNPDGYEAHFDRLEFWAGAFFGTWIRGRKIEIVNPLKLPHAHGRTYHEYLEEDLEALKTCDVIILGNRWESSSGCCQEAGLAKALGLVVLTESVVLGQETAFAQCIDGRTECCGDKSNYLCRILDKLNARP